MFKADQKIRFWVIRVFPWGLFGASHLIDDEHGQVRPVREWYPTRPVPDEEPEERVETPQKENGH